MHIYRQQFFPALPLDLAATDETASGANNGTITAMEYRSNAASNYTPVTGTTITSFTQETYLIRYAATLYYKAGAEARPSRSPSPPTQAIRYDGGRKEKGMIG